MSEVVRERRRRLRRELRHRPRDHRPARPERRGKSDRCSGTLCWLARPSRVRCGCSAAHRAPTSPSPARSASCRSRRRVRAPHRPCVPLRLRSTCTAFPTPTERPGAALATVELDGRMTISDGSPRTRRACASGSARAGIVHYPRADRAGRAPGRASIHANEPRHDRALRICSAATAAASSSRATCSTRSSASAPTCWRWRRDGSPPPADFREIRTLMDDRPRRVVVRTSEPRLLAADLVHAGVVVAGSRRGRRCARRSTPRTPVGSAARSPDSPAPA